MKRPIAFRAPDQQFISDFNEAAEITGLNVSQLCVRCIRSSLSSVVQDVIHEQERCEQHRKTLREHFLRRVGKITYTPRSSPPTALNEAVPARKP